MNLSLKQYWRILLFSRPIKTNQSGCWSLSNEFSQPIAAGDSCLSYDNLRFLPPLRVAVSITQGQRATRSSEVCLMLKNFRSSVAVLEAIAVRVGWIEALAFLLWLCGESLAMALFFSNLSSAEWRPVERRRCSLGFFFSRGSNNLITRRKPTQMASNSAKG